MWGSVLFLKVACWGQSEFVWEHVCSWGAFGWMAGVCKGWSCLCVTLIGIKVWGGGGWNVTLFIWDCGHSLSKAWRVFECHSQKASVGDGLNSLSVCFYWILTVRIEWQSSGLKAGTGTGICLLMFPITPPYLGRGVKKKAICGDVVKLFVCSDLLMECLAFTRLCLRRAFKEGKKKWWKKMVTKTGRGEKPVGQNWKKEQRMSKKECYFAQSRMMLLVKLTNFNKVISLMCAGFFHESRMGGWGGEGVGRPEDGVDR